MVMVQSKNEGKSFSDGQKKGALQIKSWGSKMFLCLFHKLRGSINDN